MKFAAMVPDRVTGRLVPYLGVAGIPITFNAPDQDAANRPAKLNRLPPAVLVLPDELTRRDFLGSSPAPVIGKRGAVVAVQRPTSRTVLSMARRGEG